MVLEDKKTLKNKLTNADKHRRGRINKKGVSEFTLNFSRMTSLYSVEFYNLSY